MTTTDNSTDHPENPLRSAIIEALAVHAPALPPNLIAMVLTDILADFTIYCKVPKHVFMEAVSQVYDVNAAYYAENPRETTHVH